MNEKKALFINGYLGILIVLALIGGAVFFFFQNNIIVCAILAVIGVLIASGITVIQPNQSVVVIFFGQYLGSIRESGLFLTVPLTVRRTVSLRVRNFNSKKLKVNDVEGNPIEIAAVIVFKVVDSAKAIFDVNDYEEFVEIQSETAIRAVATKYPYDTFGDHELTLRGNADIVSNELTEELQTLIFHSH